MAQPQEVCMQQLSAKAIYDLAAEMGVLQCDWFSSPNMPLALALEKFARLRAFAATFPLRSPTTQRPSRHTIFRTVPSRRISPRDRAAMFCVT